MLNVAELPSSLSMENEIAATQKEEYDLIISLGQNCACTVILREAGLQEYSYPFDWLDSLSFDTQILLLVNGFKNFCNKEDFSIYENKEKAAFAYNFYQNKRTGFLFFHDFPKELHFDEAFDTVKQKYERRIKRMYDKIDASKKVLFIRFAQSRFLEDQQIINAYALLSRKFSKQEISFLILENNSELKTIEKQDYVMEGKDARRFATKYTYMMCSDFNNQDTAYQTYGDFGKVGAILNEYGLRPYQQNIING